MFDVIGRFATCFTDHRNPSRVEHSVEAMLRQRVYGICLVYEDVNECLYENTLNLQETIGYILPLAVNLRDV